jgi:SAM-dependent methyltransferase
MHSNTELLFNKYAKQNFQSNAKVLEVGPTGFPSAFQELVNNSNITWHTIDFADSIYVGDALSELTYTLSNPYEFPVQSEQYDIVISGNVIEHVAEVWKWLKELKRVLKPGGIVVTINPISWPYHEAPLDCWRIYPEGIKALANEIGLLVKECHFSSLEIDIVKKWDKEAVTIPGKSLGYESSREKMRRICIWNRFIRNFPIAKDYLQIPIEVAYDCFSILQKKE